MIYLSIYSRNTLSRKIFTVYYCVKIMSYNIRSLVVNKLRILNDSNYVIPLPANFVYLFIISNSTFSRDNRRYLVKK